MVEKGKKQKGMLCGEIFAVRGLHIQGYVLSFLYHSYILNHLCRNVLFSS